MPNTNCLEGFKCPKCGSEGPFWINVQMHGRALMSDDGVEDDYSMETNWYPHSPVECPECGEVGNAKDFNPEMYKEVQQ